MGEVLSLFQQCLHQGAAHAGVAVSVHPVGEPRARDADLGGVAALHHAVVSVTPFLHCFHDVSLSTHVLLLVSRRRQGVVLGWPVLLQVMGVFWLRSTAAQLVCPAGWVAGFHEKGGFFRPASSVFFRRVSRLRNPQLCGT